MEMCIGGAAMKQFYESIYCLFVETVFSMRL